MKIALISSSILGSASLPSKTGEFTPSFRETPATLILGDGNHWFLGSDLLPVGFCDGNAADSIKLITQWASLRGQLRTDARPVELPPADEFLWLPPVVEPNKILCIGLNYADHASETGAELPTIPVVFNKFPTTLTGHGQPIFLPPISNKVDYEAELVVVIGKEGRNIPASSAFDYVFGYTCGHDVSARDWQKGKPGGQWLLGKTFDSFAPLGPWIQTPDGVGDAGDLRVQFRLNGDTMQDSSTRHFIFSLPFLIEHLSKFCTLRPGDLLFTGTPSGVGVARNPPVFLKPGDLAEVEIEGLGVLANPVFEGQ